jgi:hypothetical protein
VAFCLLGALLRAAEALSLGLGRAFARGGEACFRRAARCDPPPADPPVSPDDGRD